MNVRLVHRLDFDLCVFTYSQILMSKIFRLEDEAD